MTIRPTDWTWLGTAGHVPSPIADHLRFHLHTHVGRYCVSTVGELLFKPGTTEFETLTAGCFYETKAFLLVNGEHDGREIGNTYTPYDSREAAQAGHRRACLRWAGEVAKVAWEASR